jgi:hypothetical protein
MPWLVLAIIFECAPEASKRCLQPNMPVLRRVLEKLGRDCLEAKPCHKVRLVPGHCHT